MSLYDDLGVTADVSPEDLKSAYRAAVKRTHPDSEGGDADEFDKVQKAYDVLSDPERRATYDRDGTTDHGVEDSGLGQIAHFICEMHERLRLVDLVDAQTFRLPMSQTDLSDAMGLSLVHVNRTLQQLRRRSLISWQNDSVRIIDLHGLRELAEFDATYLDTRQSPR